MTIGSQKEVTKADIYHALNVLSGTSRELITRAFYHNDKIETLREHNAELHSYLDRAIGLLMKFAENPQAFSLEHYTEVENLLMDIDLLNTEEKK